MKGTFTYYNPTIQEIDLQSEDIFDMLHEEDRSPDNPVVCEVMEVLEQVPQISKIQGGYIVFEDIERFAETGEIRIAGQTIKTSRKVCRFMEGAEKIAVFICTAGQGFTDYSNEYNKEGEYLKGYITDTMGSVVVEKLPNTMFRVELENGSVFLVASNFSPPFSFLFCILPNHLA